MPRLVALLRGVNVGGRSLSMAALRDTLDAAGCRDVVTYIQSGNVVLTPPSPTPGDPAAWLAERIGALAGFDVPVVVRTADELAHTVGRNPYPGVEGTKLHVVFFEQRPPADLLDAVDLAPFAPEHATLAGRDLYLHLPNGMGRAKLPTEIERVGRRVDPPALGTARNWNTVLRLLDLAGAGSGEAGGAPRPRRKKST